MGKGREAAKKSWILLAAGGFKLLEIGDGEFPCVGKLSLGSKVGKAPLPPSMLSSFTPSVMVDVSGTLGMGRSIMEQSSSVPNLSMT